MNAKKSLSDWHLTIYFLEIFYSIWVSSRHKIQLSADSVGNFISSFRWICVPMGIRQKVHALEFRMVQSCEEWVFTRFHSQYKCNILIRLLLITIRVSLSNFEFILKLWWFHIWINIYAIRVVMKSYGLLFHLVFQFMIERTEKSRLSVFPVDFSAYWVVSNFLQDFLIISHHHR